MYHSENVLIENFIVNVWMLFIEYILHPLLNENAVL